MNKINGISVIICCYNSSSRIKATLEHLAKQKINHPFDWEIILIDNNSSDKTSDYASKIWQSLGTNIPLRIFTEKQQGLIFAKNRGIKEAQFDLLLFCDDDNWLSEDYISIGFSFMKENKDIGLIGGKGNPVFEKDFIVPFWFQEASKFHYATHEPNQERNNEAHIYGAGSIIRKEIFYLLRKYDYDFILSGRSGKKIISGEDIETSYLCKILGYGVSFLSILQFNHFLPKEKINESWITHKMMDTYSPLVILAYRDYYQEKIKSVSAYYSFVLIRFIKVILVALKKTLFFNWNFYSKLWFKSQIKSCLFFANNYTIYKNTIIKIKQLHHNIKTTSLERNHQ